MTHISDTLVRRSQGGSQRQAISWSRQGHVAYATKDARRLLITYLECVDGSTWQLAPATPIGDEVEGSAIQLTSFSNTGWDLFLADTLGNVTIMVTGIRKVEDTGGMPAIQFSRTSFNTAEQFYRETGEQSEIVAVKWLNIDKPVSASVPAVKAEQTGTEVGGAAGKLGAAEKDAAGFCYKYSAHQYKPYGAMHPLAAKQAVIGIRRNGQLCLWYQEDHGIEYRRVVAGIDLESSADEVVDASVAFTRDGSVVVAVHTAASNSLKIYEVAIDWGFLVEAAKHLPKMPSYRVPDNERIPPKLLVSKIAKYNLGDLCATNQRLVAVDLISPNYHQATEMELLLTFETERRYSEEAVESSLVRYRLKKVPSIETVHSAFKEIQKDGAPTPAKLHYTLKYVQKFTFDESIVAIEPTGLDMVVCITFASGVVRVLDRNSFHFRAADTPGTAITTLFDVGFEFPAMEFQPQYCCISPNVCAYVSLPVDEDTLHVRVASCVSSQGLLATTAAFAHCHTSACYLGYFTDDLLCAIRSELHRVTATSSQPHAYRFMVALLQECQHAIGLNIDMAADQVDKLSQSQPLQRMLALQLALGTGPHWHRNRSARIAMSLANLRFASSGVVFAIQTIYMNTQRFSKKGTRIPDTYTNSRLRESSIVCILGAVRWVLDYVAFLSKELLLLHSQFSANTGKVDINRLVTCLVLGKIPRAYLLYALSNIRKLFSFTQKFVEKAYPDLAVLATPENPLGAFKEVQKRLLETPEDQATPQFVMLRPTLQAYYRLGALMDSCPVPVLAFEKFLLAADKPLRTNMRLDAATSLAVEQQLVCQGYVASSFTEPLRKLCEVFDKTVLSFPAVDPTRLYFYDTQWLQFSDEQLQIDFAPPLECTDFALSQSEAQDLLLRNFHDGLLLDDLRKELLKPDEYASIRFCTRCGSVSSVTDEPLFVPGHPDMIENPLFQHYQRICFCGGSWANMN